MQKGCEVTTALKCCPLTTGPKKRLGPHLAACIKVVLILHTHFWCASLLCLFRAPTLKVLSNLCCTIPDGFIKWCLAPPVDPVTREALGDCC